MSGYGGADLESELAIQMSENGIEAHRQALQGRVLSECLDCGQEINPKRVEFLRSKNMKCEYCVDCQSNHDGIKLPKMLTNML
jgi:RNA polymerase-binding transcription factor DksA